jgi:hypothetical protein
MTSVSCRRDLFIWKSHSATFLGTKNLAIRLLIDRRKPMRIPLVVLCLATSTSFLLAQQTPAPTPAPNPAARSRGEPTGNATIPENTGKQQPQGKTGPLETEGKGTTPENPQGGTPEGMQVHPTEPK